MRTALLSFAFFILAFPVFAQSNTLSEKDVLQVLTSADTSVLYSLEPSRGPDANGDQLHHFPVLGKTELDQGKTHKAVDAFQDAISTWKKKSFSGAMACFNPRHALRVIENGHVYDFLLCYECLQLEVFMDDKNVAWLGAAGSPDALNAMLRTANVPLAKD